MVREDMETLSDNSYITFSVGFPSIRTTCNRRAGRRWNLSKLDKTTFDLSLTWTCYDDAIGEENLSARNFARWLDDTVREACDVSAPRIGCKQPRRAANNPGGRAAYWWSDFIAELRSVCIKARRRWIRGRKAGRSIIMEVLRVDYQSKKKDLKRAISKAKSAAWRELILTLDSDPWGLPYCLVLNRLRRSSPGFSELLEPAVLDRLLDGLFLKGSDRDIPGDWRDWQ